MTNYEKATAQNLAGGARCSANICFRAMEQLQAEIHMMKSKFKKSNMIDVVKNTDEAMHLLKKVIDYLPNTNDIQEMIEKENEVKK